ncbi:MAG: MATE family efflux transporter [Oscillospiraceae bacterium]
MKNDYIVRKTYYSFVFVSILSSLTATAGMLIDNIIVGRYLGSDALGAMGIVGPVSLVFSAIGNICSGGGGARSAQALGRGDRNQFRLIFTTCMLFVLLIGGILTVLGLLFAPEVAVLLGAKETLLEPATDYLYGFFLGTIPTILLSAMMCFVRIDGSPKLPLICISVMSAANIVLDLMMVYVFHQGMFGMALATTISYVLAVATALTHFLKKDATLRLVRPKGFFKDLSQTVLTGFPTAISRISDTCKVMLLNNLLVSYVSVAAVTALNVRTTVSNFLGAVVLGIGQAATPTIGMFFGEEDRTAVKDTLKTTLRLGLLLNGVLAVILLVFPTFFAHLLGVKDMDIMNMSSVAIRLLGLGMPLQLINSALLNYYQSTKKVGMATMICVLQSLVYTVLFALILIRPMGATGVWLAFLSGEILTLLTVGLVLCIRNRKIAISLDSVLMLDENFGGDPKDRLELSIGNSMDEVMLISSGIYKFGRNRSITQETLNLLSLCIEEMAGNVVQHAFKPGEKRWLDLTIMDKPDRVIVRIRDNGTAFDPLAYLSSGEERGYGILMIHKLAESFEYRRSMGLNNLIIHLRKEESKI